VGNGNEGHFLVAAADRPQCRAFLQPKNRINCQISGYSQWSQRFTATVVQRKPALNLLLRKMNGHCRGPRFVGRRLDRRPRKCSREIIHQEQIALQLVVSQRPTLLDLFGITLHQLAQISFHPLNGYTGYITLDGLQQYYALLYRLSGNNYLR